MAFNVQPAFLAAVITSKENSNSQLSDVLSEKHPNEANHRLESNGKNFLDAILQCVRKSDELMKGYVYRGNLL